jgi:hypothetical protein
VRSLKVESWLIDLASRGVKINGISKGTEEIESNDPSMAADGHSSGDESSKSSKESSKPDHQSYRDVSDESSIPSSDFDGRELLDCNKNYSTIRSGGTGICRNSTSGYCYPYSNGDVQYDLKGGVNCPSH